MQFRSSIGSGSAIFFAANTCMELLGHNKKLELCKMSVGLVCRADGPGVPRHCCPPPPPVCAALVHQPQEHQGQR